MSFIYALSDNRWSNGATTYNGIWMDFTNGAGGSAVGAAASRIFKLTNNGTPLFGINLSGQIIPGMIDGTFLLSSDTGSVQVNNFDGIYGTFRMGFTFSGSIIAPAFRPDYVIKYNSLTLASLSALIGAASAGAGAMAYISDCTNTVAFRATAVGGGTTPTPVYSDGTQWRSG